MAKEKEVKTCKADCVENINGHCRLKIKDSTPSDYSKIKEGIECIWYRKVKNLFELEK